jgi:hypothetical protein
VADGVFAVDGSRRMAARSSGTLRLLRENCGRRWSRTCRRSVSRVTEVLVTEERSNTVDRASHADMGRHRRRRGPPLGVAVNADGDTLFSTKVINDEPSSRR